MRPPSHSCIKITTLYSILLTVNRVSSENGSTLCTANYQINIQVSSKQFKNVTQSLFSIYLYLSGYAAPLGPKLAVLILFKKT